MQSQFKDFSISLKYDNSSKLSFQGWTCDACRSLNERLTHLLSCWFPPVSAWAEWRPGLRLLSSLQSFSAPDGSFDLVQITGLLWADGLIFLLLDCSPERVITGTLCCFFVFFVPPPYQQLNCLQRFSHFTPCSTNITSQGGACTGNSRYLLITRPSSSFKPTFFLRTTKSAVNYRHLFFFFF